MSFGAKLIIGIAAVAGLYATGRYLQDQNVLAVAYLLGGGVTMVFFSWLKSDTRREPE